MAKQPILRRRMRTLGLAYYPPNYVYYANFSESSLVADVGCGYEAELSRHMIEEYGLSAVGVDPTRKHARFLAQLAQQSGGRFTHLPVAVTRESGTLTFHESRDNESGSVLVEHTNVRQDRTIAYPVEAVSLGELVRRLGRDRIDFLKLDLEGAEYDLLGSVTETELQCVGQLFVEFHHHCTDHTIGETRALVRRLAGAGFKVFTLDDLNYLFYR